MIEGRTHRPLCGSERAAHLSSKATKTHPQEGEVPAVLHHGDLKVAHHDLTAGVNLFGEVVLDLRVSGCAQHVLCAGANGHCNSKECPQVNECR